MASLAQNFTVILREQRFVLSRSQIDFDAPNYFTMCFLGEFAESVSREVELSRDPHLFKIIVDYLCGYTVLPIRQDALPPTMSPEVALANLRVDAAFYQLEGLLAAINAINETNESIPNLLIAKVRRQHMFRTRFKVVGWTESPDAYATYEGSLNVPDPARFIVGLPSTDDIIDFLETEEEEMGDEARYESSPMYSIIRHVVDMALLSQAPTIEDWDLLGWRTAPPDNNGRIRWSVYVSGWSKKELSMRL
ncbi:hypothetical protein BDV93DRAFT_524964 [Ceratobasidium sp. AG-I]|nr:hypothetical protein BDV93DRAFT_524964 [Ceratobasidium sp. AG-I]